MAKPAKSKVLKESRSPPTFEPATLLSTAAATIQCECGLLQRPKNTKVTTRYATTLNPKAMAYRGKGGQKYRYCFSCLKVRGGSLPSKKGQLQGLLRTQNVHHLHPLLSLYRNIVSALLILGPAMEQYELWW